MTMTNDQLIAADPLLAKMFNTSAEEAFFEAVKSDDTEKVTGLVMAEGVKPDALNKAVKKIVNTGLELAVHLKLKNMVKCLVDLGADINFLAGGGIEPCCATTPLNVAIKNRDTDMIDFLVALGADVNLMVGDMNHALWHADLYAKEMGTYLKQKHGAKYQP